MQNLSEILLKYQLEFAKASAKRKIWVSSRQIGKSFTIAFIMVMKCLLKPNGLSLCVSVNSRSASEILKKCEMFARAVKLLSNGTIDYRPSYDKIEFSTGSRVLSLPSTADSLRGFTADCVCVDEAAFIRNLDDIMQGIAPTLTRNPNSELILTTTPAGKVGPFFDLYQEAIEDDKWYVQSTTVHDAIEDGLEVDLESLHSLCPDPDVFAQEYECVFSSEFGSMIDINLLDWYDELPKGARTSYLGCDIGSTNDRTAFVEAITIGDVTYIEDVVVMHKASYEHQLDVLKGLHDKKRFSSGYVDKTGIGSAFAEFATKKVSSRIQGFQFTASNKTPMHERLRSKIFDHKIAFNRKFKKEIEDDFRNVERLVTEAGDVKYVAGRSDNGHSDITSAIILSLQAINDIPGNASIVRPYTPFSRF